MADRTNESEASLPQVENDENISDIDRQIMKLIHPERIELYKCCCNKEVRHSFPLCVFDITMLNFNKPSKINQVGTIEGKISVRDLIATDRSTKLQKLHPPSLSKDAISHWISCIANSQNSFDKSRTAIFGLNPLGMELCTKQILKKRFDEFVQKNKPMDIFSKDYILIPVMNTVDVFLTIVLNPMECISDTGNCKMIHLSTDNPISEHKLLGNYRKYRVPRIVQLLEMFLDYHRKNEGPHKINKEKIQHTELILPHCKEHSLSYALLYTINKLIGPRANIDDYQTSMESIVKHPQIAWRGAMNIRRKMDKEIKEKIIKEHQEIPLFILKHLKIKIEDDVRTDKLPKKYGPSILLTFANNEEDPYIGYHKDIASRVQQVVRRKSKRRHPKSSVGDPWIATVEPPAKRKTK